MDSQVITHNVNDIAEILRSKGNVAILVHNSMDGDTLGSGVALGHALQKLNKGVAMIIEEGHPDYLDFLIRDCGFYLKLSDDEGAIGRAWDAVVICDTADPKLLGKREKMLKLSDCVINIDHHVSNRGFGDYNLIDDDASATAEIIYRLNEALGVPMDFDTAVAIYTGICTDTGGFSYANTTGESHRIAAETLRFGIDVAHLRYKFFDAISRGKLHCYAYVASNLKIHGGGKFAIAVVPESALSEIGASEADCEGLVNIGRNVVGVEVSLLAREIKAGEFRVNLRSRGDFDVACVARKFNGGGHKMAAGCTIAAAPNEIESILLQVLNEG